MRDEYKRILVAVDDSDQAKQAVHEAVAITKRNKSSLFILHIKDETMLSGTPLALTISLEDLEEKSRTITEDVSNSINEEVKFELHSFMGNPKKEIVKFAKENNIDLIVIGSNSKGLINRMLVGSTTTYVVSHSPCNVMVVK